MLLGFGWSGPSRGSKISRFLPDLIYGAASLALRASSHSQEGQCPGRLEARSGVALQSSLNKTIYLISLTQFQSVSHSLQQELAQTHVHRVGYAIQPSHPLLPLLLPSVFPRIGVFSKESVLRRWPKNWSFSFSISPSNEYSGLKCFTIEWFDLFAVQGTLESSTTQFKSINSLTLSFLYGPTFTSIHDYWKKTIALPRWTFVSKVMSLLFNM